MVLNFIQKIIGTKNDRELKRIQAQVDRINAWESKAQELSDSQLKDKSSEFKKRYQEGESLDDILPEAFAVVREAGQRGIFANKLRVITDLGDSPTPTEKDWGVGGPYGLSAQSFSTSLEREAVSMVDRLSVNLEELDQQAKAQAVSLQQLDEFFKNQKSLLSSTPSVWPTRGWVTSGFGLRKSPLTGRKEKHKGWDIGARLGSTIRATADGVVRVSGRESGYGKMLEIDHGYGISTRYGHNSKNLVKVGDRIKRGDLIALVGSTGRSTGPHLHYEVLLSGVSVNPKNYILED